MWARWFSIPIALLGLVLSGCDQSLNPKAPFQKQLVVFSILSNASDTQYVRVSTNYDVTGFDPSENQVDQSIIGAQVIVTGPSNSYRFEETLLPRGNTSRYKTPIHAYAVSPFSPELGKTYNLAVTTGDLGTASGSVTIPEKGSVLLEPTWITVLLDTPDPDLRYVNLFFHVSATLSGGCKGYLIQMFIDYEVLSGSDWTQKRTEVPRRVLVDTLGMWIGDYPGLERFMVNPIGEAYRYLAYRQTLIKILSNYPHQKITFHRIVARVVQFEQSVYDYYNTVNGFRDPISIRLDETDYSNIKGGKGVFGAYAIDSLVHDLPDNFGLNIK